MSHAPLSAPKIDPASLEQFKREVEHIPPQSNPRAEANRLNLKRAVARLERENKR